MAILLRDAGPQIPTDPAYYAWSIQVHLVATALAITLSALITVLGRVYIRAVTLRVFGADDYFIVAAMLLSVFACGFFLKAVQLGLGKHIYAVKDSVALLHLMFTFGVIVPVSVCFVKLSISFFLLRLTKRTQYRHVLWCIICFLVIFTLVTFFSLVLSCFPLSANWDLSLRPPPVGTGTAKCMPITVFQRFGMFNTITNIITDLILSLIPVPLVWGLQVNTRTKISLMLILSLGFFACAAAIIKMPLLQHFFDNPDWTATKTSFYVWQMIEMNIGIIAATLPSLKPAFRWLLETAKAITTGGSQNRTTRKRQSSLGYFQQKDNPVPLSSMSTHGEEVGSKKWSNKSGFKATVAKSQGSNESTDEILMSDEIHNGKGIVKTTKVTMVRS